MEDEVYAQFAQIEDTHWWYVSRRRLLEVFLSGIDFRPDSVGLDVGCGTGGTLPLVKNYCARAKGLDVSSLALDLARNKYPQYEFIDGDANHLSGLFAPGTFDLVCILNVLYHDWVDSEARVLGGVYDVLRPGGYLVVTEPAFAFLKRSHDRTVMGGTRYRIPEFHRMLVRSGLDLIRSTYFNSISFLPALAIASLERIKHPDQSHNDGVQELRLAGPVISRLMLAALMAERAVIRICRQLPVGVSLLCLARKPLKASRTGRVPALKPPSRRSGIGRTFLEDT